MVVEYFSMYDNYLINELSDVEVENSKYGKVSDKEIYEMICENMPESEGYGFSHRYKELKKVLKDGKLSEEDLNDRIPDKEMYDEVYDKTYEQEDASYNLTNESIRDEESSVVVEVSEIDKGVLEESSDYSSYEVDEEGNEYEGESKGALYQVREEGVGYADVISQIITKKFPKLCREGVIGVLFTDIKYVARERYESEGIEYLSGVIAIVDLLLDDGSSKRRVMQYKIPINYNRPLEFHTLIDLEAYLGLMSEEDSKLSKGFDKIDVHKLDNRIEEGNIMAYAVGVEQNAKYLKENVEKVKVERGIGNEDELNIGDKYRVSEREGLGIKEEDRELDKLENDGEEIQLEGGIESLKEYLKKGVYLSGVRKYIRDNKEELEGLSIGEIGVKGYDIEAVWVMGKEGKEYCEGVKISYVIVLDNGSEVKYNVGLKLIDKEKKKAFKISEDNFNEVIEVIGEYKDSVDKGKGLVDKFRYKDILVYLTPKSSKEWLEELDKAMLSVGVGEVKGEKKEKESGVGMGSLGELLKELMQRVRNQRDDKHIQKSISMLSVYMNGLAEEGYQVRKHPNIKGLYVVQSAGYLLGKGIGAGIDPNTIKESGIDGGRNKVNVREVRGDKRGKSGVGRAVGYYGSQMIGGMWRGNGYKKGLNRGYIENTELVLISPYFIIAVDSKTFEYQLLYNRLNGVMSLRDAELLLVGHGYPEFKDLSYALNLRNYGTFNAVFGGVNRLKGLKREGGRGLIMSGIKRMVMTSGRSEKDSY